jgi:hypothetical protein
MLKTLFFAQGCHGNGDIRNLEAEYGVPVRRIVRHCRNAQRDAAAIEHRS